MWISAQTQKYMGKIWNNIIPFHIHQIQSWHVTIIGKDNKYGICHLLLMQPYILKSNLRRNLAPTSIVRDGHTKVDISAYMSFSKTFVLVHEEIYIEILTISLFVIKTYWKYVINKRMDKWVFLWITHLYVCFPLSSGT